MFRFFFFFRFHVFVSPSVDTSSRLLPVPNGKLICLLTKDLSGLGNTY